MTDIGKARRALAEAAQVYASELGHSNGDAASMTSLVRAALDYAAAYNELNSFRVPKQLKRRVR